jgi:hypothetical protein
MHFIFAVSSYAWPDGIDLTVLAAYLALLAAIVVAAHVFLILDIRAYLRSLRRALVLISNYGRDLPAWVRRDTPRCIQALGLRCPCTADDVLAAYRQRVKQLHPDRGGNRQDFLKLQQHFEQAMGLFSSD